MTTILQITFSNHLLERKFCFWIQISLFIASGPIDRKSTLNVGFCNGLAPRSQQPKQIMTNFIDTCMQYQASLG